MEKIYRKIVCLGLTSCCLAYPVISVLGCLNNYCENHFDELPRQIQGHIEMSNSNVMVAPASGTSTSMVRAYDFIKTSGNITKW